jgi:glycosyltransferase involved in cell wall biosynthesis
MRYSRAVSGSWEDEQARSVEHRRLVEERAARLPTERSGVGRRARRAVGKARPMAAAIRRATDPIRRRSRRFGLAASSWRHHAARPARNGGPSASGRAPDLHPGVTCVVFGAAGGPAGQAARDRGCRVVIAPSPLERVELGASELVCLMAATTEPCSPDWLDRLTAAIHADVVAVAPTLVHPHRSLLDATPHDHLVRSRGLQLAARDGAPILRARDAGEPPLLADLVDTVDAVTGACILVSRKALERAGGVPPTDDVDAAVVELCARIHDEGGRLIVTSSMLAIDHRRVVERADLYEPFASRQSAWRAIVERHGPALLRRATNTTHEERLRIALTIGAPSEKVAPRWGDWHLANGLARALERRGHVVRIQTADHADDLAGRACDVHVVIRGLCRVTRTSGQRHVLWVISHPEAIDARECDEADLVLVASTQFARHLRAKTSTPVEVVLQATDQHRFRRVPARSEHNHPVAVVAKTRDVPRPIVLDAIAAGLRPAIYGTGWEPIVDPGLIAAHYVPNDELPQVYSSVGVLLNDHWEAMRTWGFVSNRLFDALACGTPVISDDMPEIAELFGDAIVIARGPSDLRAAVHSILADEAAARARADRGKAVVLAAHTFDHRADQMLGLFARHGLLTGAVRRRS